MLQPVLTRDAIIKLQQIVRRVLVGQTVAAYAVQLVRATRPKGAEAPDFVKKYLTWGAGPRACQAMLLGAKARALLAGRYHVAIEDIRYVAGPVLRHRLVTSFTAEADGISADQIVKRLCESISEPKEV
jgi:MoxR-like ATPase